MDSGTGNPCRQVVDTVYILQQRPELRDIFYVATGEEHLGIEARGIAGTEVIQGPHVMSFPNQTICQCGADETSPASDEESQFSI